MNIEPVLILSLIITMSATIQTMLGFGFALIAVPMLSLIIPLKIVVPLIVITSTITNTVIVLSTYKEVKLKEMKFLILFGLLGIPLGVWSLTYLNKEVLKLILNLLVIITTLAMIGGIKLRFRNKRFLYSLVGFLSGVLNGSISMSGPPVVIFLVNEEYNKDQFRANICFSAIIINIVTILFFAKSGFLSVEVMIYTFSALFALIVGSTIGSKISKEISDQMFKKVVYFMLLVISLINVVKLF